MPILRCSLHIETGYKDGKGWRRNASLEHTEEWFVSSLILRMRSFKNDTVNLTTPKVMLLFSHLYSSPEYQIMSEALKTFNRLCLCGFDD